MEGSDFKVSATEKIHPLVLGSGRRLFGDGGAFAALTRRDTKTTGSGVVIATYQQAKGTNA
jgi:hypothetical protein